MINCQRHGFTLIELLAAVAILSVLMVSVSHYLYDNPDVRYARQKQFADQLAKRELNRILVTKKVRGGNQESNNKKGSRFFMDVSSLQSFERLCVTVQVASPKETKLSEFKGCYYE